MQVASHMQGSVSTWEGLLCATGGALVPDKCFWYLIDFKLQNGKWNYCTIDCLLGTLFVHDHNRKFSLIPQLETSEALGVCIAPDGNVLTKL